MTGEVGGVAETAARLRALPPSCGATRLVAVDGHAGSGKTTFADFLAGALDGAPVVHLDDLATHEEPFGWVTQLMEGVVCPLRQGEAGRHQVYDWVARRFGGERAVPAAPVVLLDGVGAGRRAVRPALAHLLWMDLPQAVARSRGERRDGAALEGFWRWWARAERAHFTADPSRPYADLLVCQDGDGYQVRTSRR